MRWIRTAMGVVLAVSLSACGDNGTPANEATPTVQPADLATSSTSTSTSTPGGSVTSAPASTASSTLDAGVSPDLMPIFDLLGERTWVLQAIGYDEATDRHVIYTKTGEGLPSIDYAHEVPALRTPHVWADDGGGRVPGEAHMISRDTLHSFDVYWTSNEVTEVRSLRTGADALNGREARRLHSTAGARVVFEDITNAVDPNRGPMLRSHSAGTTGQFSQDWSVQFDADIVFALDVGSGRMLVATVAPGDSSDGPIDRLHLVEDDGFVRSITAPNGLLWIQLPGESFNSHETCGNQRVGLASTGRNGVEWWDIDTTNQLLTACTGGTPISTTVWCCGMGEFQGSFDSNNDGVEEVFVGGTSVGGGGGGMYSLVDDHLAPIKTDDGEELHLFSGDVGNSFGKYGCRDELFVQVQVTAEGNEAWATRTFYRIDGHSATIVDVERIEWRMDDSIAPDRSIWGVYEAAPDEIVNDLFPCESPDSFALPNTDGLRIHIQPRPFTTESSCELLWPRPYSPLILVGGTDGTETLWDPASGDDISLHWIEPDDFIATDDGRFALLDYFPCSHEGTIKTIYVGRYEPMSGRLLEWQRIEPPEEYVAQVFYQRHPDRLVIDGDGTIVGELDTESGTLLLALG